MKIKQLHLQNYGRFEDQIIDFAPTSERQSNVTVIVGNNGAGKSQILQALATGMSWFVNGVIDQNNEGFYLNEYDIRNGKTEATIKINVEDVIGKKCIEAAWSIGARKTKFLPVVNSFIANDLKELKVGYLKKLNLERDINLPIVAYYPVERNVKKTFAEVDDNIINRQFRAYNYNLQNSSNFADFFLWFREREDIENERIASLSINIKNEASKNISSAERLNNLLETFKISGNDKDDSVTINGKLLHELIKLADGSGTQDKVISNAKFNDSQLNFTRKAIQRFTSFQNPRIRRQDKPTMIVEKDGEELDVNQLSQGEKSLLALVGDIARRLAILNPSLDNPLEGDGVVMIDEVDLHLHPKWQHDLIDKLVTTFPNVQFILTTHSPHVISDRNDILLYSLDDGELTQMPNVYGEDVNTVLSKIMDVDIRDSKVEKQFTEIRRAISKREYQIAENKINNLSDQLPSDNLELLKCRLMLAQAKLANSDNSNHATN